MLVSRDIVEVEHIVKPLIEYSFRIVEKFFNCKEVTNEPMPSTVIGLYMINTENKSNHFCAQIMLMNINVYLFCKYFLSLP